MYVCVYAVCRNMCEYLSPVVLLTFNIGDDVDEDIALTGRRGDGSRCNMQHAHYSTRLTERTWKHSVHIHSLQYLRVYLHRMYTRELNHTYIQIQTVTGYF